MKKISAKDKLAAYEGAAARVSFHKSISGQTKSINAIVNAMAAFADAEALADKMKGTEHEKQAAEDATKAFEAFRAAAGLSQPAQDTKLVGRGGSEFV